LLPDKLLDTLDAPVPIIAGISFDSLDKLINNYDLSQEFID
jgi:hypothetical protein